MEKPWPQYWVKNVNAVKYSNLPRKAELVIIGEKYSDILNEPLKKLGVTPIFVPDNPYVDNRLSGHADLSVLHTGGEGLWLAPYLKCTGFSRALEKMGFQIFYPDIVQSATYPGDAQLNLCICGDKLIYNQRTAAQEIEKYLTNICGLETINSRQGYTKCSVCIVDRGAIITADKGIAEASKKVGMDVLLISAGGVELEGFYCGFIGGAAFKLSREVLAFTGHLDKHPDRDAILSFLDSRGVRPTYLTDRPLFDIGSGLPITETDGSL